MVEAPAYKELVEQVVQCRRDMRQYVEGGPSALQRPVDHGHVWLFRHK